MLSGTTYGTPNVIGPFGLFAVVSPPFLLGRLDLPNIVLNNESQFSEGMVWLRGKEE